MTTYLGNFLLSLSLFFAISQFFVSKKNKFRFISITVNGLLISSLLSFGLLMYSHIISDFSILNVFQNSHTTIPLLYKIAGVWGNHEGSMLLWILVLTIFNYLIFKLYNNYNSNFILKTLETQALITIGFVLFTNRYTNKDTKFQTYKIIHKDLIKTIEDELDIPMICFYQDFSEEELNNKELKPIEINEQIIHNLQDLRKNSQFKKIQRWKSYKI